MTLILFKFHPFFLTRDFTLIWNRYYQLSWYHDNVIDTYYRIFLICLFFSFFFYFFLSLKTSFQDFYEITCIIMYTLRIKHKHSFHCILCIYFNFLFQFFYFFRVVVIRLRLHTVCILIRTRHTNRYVCLERAEVQRSIKSTYQA